MQFVKYNDHESISNAAVNALLHSLSKKTNTVFCLATGSTPIRTYELLADAYKKDKSIFSHLRIVGLDEWVGLPADHPVTCTDYLRKRILIPLNIPDERYIGFNPDVNDDLKECLRVQNLLSVMDGIDVCVLGLGLNGHVGMNEPNHILQAYAHKTKLSEEMKAHSMLESVSKKPEYGFTLGMADILGAKKIILLVSGNQKLAPLRTLCKQQIDTNFPASFLWLHKDVTVYTDCKLK